MKTEQKRVKYEIRNSFKDFNKKFNIEIPKVTYYQVIVYNSK